MSLSVEVQRVLMHEAVAVCRAGVAAGQSPFGAVIATAGGEVIQASHNRVRSMLDPTAHAEITAIRAACRTLRTIDLSGYVMATTCEPCPMCAAAIHWARLDTVIFGARISDAQKAGFNELPMPMETLVTAGPRPITVYADVLRDECAALFDEWLAGPNPVPY